MPIRLRLALLFAVVTAAVATAFGFLFVSQLSTGLRHSVAAALTSRTRTLLQQLPETGTPPTGPQVQQGSLGGDLGDTQDITQVVSATDRVLVAAGLGSTRPLVGPAALHRARLAPISIEASIGRHPDHFLLLVTAAPGGHAFVVVGQSLATADQAVQRVTVAIAAGGTLAVVVAAAGAWFLAGLALSPVERMRRQAEEISEKDTTAALTVPRSRDEVARLARTLNDLLGRIHAALDRERGFSAAAGHELRSPLTRLRAELELAGRPGRSPDYLSAAVQRSIGEVDRMVDLADRLLLLSRGDEGAVRVEPLRTDLLAVVDAAVAGLRPRLAAAGVTVVVHAAGDVTAVVDPVAYRRIVENLVENAIHHGGDVHHVDVTLRGGPDQAELEVADDGRGFPTDFLARAFERFSRADASRSRHSGGAGLGLSIVRALAEAHGGTAAAGNAPGGGAVVTVRVPLDHELPASGHRSPG